MVKDRHQGEKGKRPRYLLLFVILWILFVQASTRSSNIDLSPPLSWWNARAYCMNEYNGDLYMSTSRPDLQNSNLQPNMSYWVGALEASEWKWTDGSSPFSHIGNVAKNTLVTQLTYRNISGNSLAQCYRHCYNETYFGLSETRCYCLDKSKVSTSIPGDENPCPGHFREKCGNANGISIYQTDIHFVDGQNGQCLFAYQWDITGPLIKKFEAGVCESKYYAVCSEEDWNGSLNCSSDKYYKCIDGMCGSCRPSTWTHASNLCTLAKVIKKNKDKFFSLILKNTNNSIGLNKTTKKMWINGNEVEDSYQHEGNGTQVCLALLYREDNSSIPIWKPCNAACPALCEKPKFTTGLYIGSGIGVALLVSLLVAVIVVIRRRKVYFQKQQTTTEVGSSNSNNRKERVEGLYDMSLDLVDHTTSAEACSNAPDIVSTLYSKVDNTEREIAKANNNGWTETLKKTKNIGFDDGDDCSRAGPIKSPEVVENCYSHLKVDQEKGYDIACRKAQNEQKDTTFNQLDAMGLNQDCYSHIKVGEENDYDIAGYKPNVSRLDDTYNHLDAIRVDKEGSHERCQEEDADYYN